MGVGRILASEHSEFKKDELVVGHMGWAQYVVVPECGPLRKIQPLEFPLSYHLGVLGFGGFSAYVGFFKICKPKKGEKVLVSAAMGSVGNLVGQFAKLFGCYVVGCAGSQDKVELLKDKFGFDNAFNYKEERDLNVALQRYFPEGIDIYFDNVGGEMLEAAVSNMNKYGRVAACGVISEYTNNNNNNNNNSNNDTNDESKTLIRGPNMIDVIYKCLTIQGFIVSDHKDCFPDFISTMEDHLRADRIKVIEDVSHGVESIPSAFVGLFCGRNVGKKVVQIEDDHTIS